jgi:hypothetical protein
MANFFSQIAELNNIQFVLDDVQLPSGVHSLPYFQQWFKDHIRDWQFNRNYEQPIEQDDKQYLILKRTGFNSVYFMIYSCDGTPQILRPAETGDAKYQVFSDLRIDDSGDVYVLSDGSEQPLIYHQWNFRFSDYNLPDGTYYMAIPVEYFDGVTLVETRLWVSEPINLQDAHDDTILINYTNDSNKDDVIFKYDMSDGSGFIGLYVKPVFGLRIEGDVINPKVGRSDAELKEQDFEQRLLQSYSWDAFDLYIGGDNGVPFYLLSKVNKIIGCDNLQIDKMRYVKDEGADWQIDEQATYPLYCASMQVQLYDKRDKVTDKRGEIIEFADLSGGYPLAIESSGLGVVGAGVVLDNDTDRDDFIDDMNNTYLDYYNLEGYLDVVGDKIFYYAATGENLTRFTPKVTSDYTSFDIATNAANQTMVFVFDGFHGVIDWGDVFITGYDAKYQQYFNVPVGVSQNRTFTYPNTGGYIVRLFHFNDCFNVIVRKGTGNVNRHTCTIGGITGNVPQGLESFSCIDNNLGAFSLDFLHTARTNIKEITFRNCGITGFVTNVFADYSSIGIGGSSGNWGQLNIVDIKNNQLSQVEQEAFINDFYTHAPHVIVGRLDTQQNPANTITDVSAVAAIAALNGAGWTTTT